VAEADAFLNVNELGVLGDKFPGDERDGICSRDLGCGAAGSEEIAREHLLQDGIKVHYCPSAFKDAVQLESGLSGVLKGWQGL
jgi:pyruvate formate-lyase activating enzyme-like uncharacterized protein